MTKWKTIAIRVSEEQEKVIIEKAFQSKMSKNEYIKTRLFENQNLEDHKITNYERILLSSSVKSFLILQNIQQLISDLNSNNNKPSKKRLNKLLEMSDKYLVEQGFKTQEEFDKLYNASSNSNDN